MSTFDNLMDKARNVAGVASKMTSEMVESSKNKMQAFKINTNIQRAYEKLGSIVYDSAKFGTDSTSLVKACVEEIDQMLEELEEINNRIQEGRPGLVCASCGSLNPATASYCAKCGASLGQRTQEQPDVALEEVPFDAPDDGQIGQ